MNWYTKLASPALYDPHRRENTNKDGISFLNYIKQHHTRVKMYHGTMHSWLENAKKTGYLLNANMVKNPNHITPDADRNFVFFTPSREYAQGYADTALRKQLYPKVEQYTNSVWKLENQNAEKWQNGLPIVLPEIPAIEEDYGVLLTLSIPLYAIAEVRDVIMGSKPRQIGSQLFITEDTKEDKLKEMLRQLDSGGYGEIFTSYLGLPLKWMVKQEKVTETIIEKLNAHKQMKLEYLQKEYAPKKSVNMDTGIPGPVNDLGNDYFDDYEPSSPF